MDIKSYTHNVLKIIVLCLSLRVNLAWSMKSGLWFQVWVLQARMTLTSIFGIQFQAWYSIPVLVLNLKLVLTVTFQGKL